MTVNNELTDKGKFKAAGYGEAARLPFPQATANTKPQGFVGRRPTVR
ncbi:MAG: hypothetical protein ACI4SB_06475 [Acutalibacteraceae bacterium]